MENRMEKLQKLPAIMEEIEEHCNQKTSKYVDPTRAKNLLKKAKVFIQAERAFRKVMRKVTS